MHLACGGDITSNIRERLRKYGQRSVREMLSEPMLRPLHFSENYMGMEKSFNATSERHCVGTAVYMVGEKQEQPCKECKNRPVFNTCVAKLEVARGACASCIYRGCRSRCDFVPDGEIILDLNASAKLTIVQSVNRRKDLSNRVILQCFQ